MQPLQTFPMMLRLRAMRAARANERALLAPAAGEGSRAVMAMSLALHV